MLTDIINAIATATGLDVVPFKAGAEEAIIYEWNPESDNGTVAQDRLMIRIRTAGMQRAESLLEDVKAAVVSVGDGHKNGCYAVINGGGTLYDDASGYMDTVIYVDLTHKSKVIGGNNG